MAGPQAIGLAPRRHGTTSLVAAVRAGDIVDMMDKTVILP